MSRYTENTGKHIIAYGIDHACGPFVQVWHGTDDTEMPDIDLDGLFNGATLDTCIQVAQEWGALEVVPRMRREAVHWGEN